MSPVGGPKDVTPPGVNKKKSTPNPSTNFQEKFISITFDEWVKLEDAFNQVVISPPLQDKPDIRLKGKSVILTFGEELRPNTTYSVFFGDAVKDITENNIAKDLRVTFSTGPVIDSLKTKGQVKDAFDGKPAENILVMLYKENSEDSIVYKSKPLYVSKTDKQGKFNIGYLKEGRYKAFALKDQNQNYRYDLANEKIAFLPNPVIISDTMETEINLLLFEEQRPLALGGVNSSTFGKATFTFNEPPENIALKVLNPPADLQVYQETVDREIWFWYDTATSDSIDIAVNKEGNLLEEKRIGIPSKEAFLKKKKITVEKDQGKPASSANKPFRAGRSPNTVKFENAVAATKPISIFPGKPLQIRFNFPMQMVDQGKIQVFEDSIASKNKPAFKIASDSKRTLESESGWKPAATNQVLFLPGALQSFYGLTNDSIIVIATASLPETLGSISSEITNLKPSFQYIIELLDANDLVIQTNTASNTDKFETTYNNLPIGKFKIKIVEDANSNGKWDSGNYLTKRAPELVMLRPLEEVKPNWEIESKITFGGVKNYKPKVGN